MIKKMWVLIVMMIVSLNVQALTRNVSINCNDSIELNEVKTCTITGYSDDAVSAVSAKFKVEGSISVSNFAVDTIWQGDGEDGDIQLYTDTNKTGTFNIASFNIKGLSIGTGSINISDIVFSDAEFNDINIVKQSKSIKVVKPYIPPVEETITPAYAVEGSCKNITYTGEKQTLTSDGRFVTYENNSQVNVGSYEVRVIANSGYTFDNGTASKILNCKINKANINVTKKDYNGKYDGKIHTFELSTKPSSKIEIYYNTVMALTSKNYETIGIKEKPEVSKEGETTIYYYIHDISGNYNDYSSNSNKNNALITIEKEDTTESQDLIKNSDATLKSLKINNIEIKLISNKYEYNLETENSEVTIIGIPNDSKAKIELPKNLKMDSKEKIYEINVIAEDGTNLIYKIVVKKKINKKKLWVALGSIAAVIVVIAMAIIIKKTSYNSK